MLTADCGDFGLRIERGGVWTHHGSPIGRPALVTLFASVLRREGDEYWLITPVERGRIVVVDAPFVVVGLRVEGAGRDQNLVFETNVGDVVTADAEHPIRVATDPETGEPRPYVEARPGLEALIGRSIYYEMAELAVAGGGDGDGDGEAWGVWSGGRFFPLA